MKTCGRRKRIGLKNLGRTNLRTPDLSHEPIAPIEGMYSQSINITNRDNASAEQGRSVAHVLT
jgi:hypothetical protein